MPRSEGAQAPEEPGLRSSNSDGRSWHPHTGLVRLPTDPSRQPLTSSFHLTVLLIHELR
jgi:hypothetical protein